MSAFPLRSWRFDSWIWRFVSGVVMRRVGSSRFLIFVVWMWMWAWMEYIYICNFHVSLKTLSLLRQRHLKGGFNHFLLLLQKRLLCWCRRLWVLQRIYIYYYWAIVMLSHLVDISYLLLWILNHIFKLDLLQIFKNHLFGKHRKYPRFDFEHDAFDVLLVHNKQFPLMDRGNMTQDFFFARDQNGVDELMHFCF